MRFGLLVGDARTSLDKVLQLAVLLANLAGQEQGRGSNVLSK